MATELIKREIDGHTYQFEQLGARQSIKVMIRLGKIIGKPFAVSVGAYQGKDKPLNTSILSEAAASLCQSMDETETLSLLELLTAEKALCDGKKIDFDTHYEGKIPHLFKVLKIALDVQYGNFPDALSEFLGLGKAGDLLTPAK